MSGVSYIWDIAVKLKEEFKVVTKINDHGKNEKPTMPLWDDTPSD